MAGRIPKQFIDELLLRADIVDLIDSRVPLKKAGKDYKACCPFHEEKTASFTVSPTKQFYHCFGCGAHGTAIGFLMEYEHMSFPEAVEELAGKCGMTVPKESQTLVERGEGTAEQLRVLEEAARYYRNQLRESSRAIAYVKGRGLSGEIAAAFGLGYAPDGWDHLTQALGKTPVERETLIQAGLAVRKESGGCYDRFRDRIMFPIHDYRGRVVGFGGRVIDNGEPKYLNSPETALFHKGRELYGLYRARDAIRKAGRLIVVEGYMDVIGLARFGVDIAVATLGTAATADHIKRLFAFASEIVFCFDGDRAGNEAAWRALEVVLPALHEQRYASFMFLPQDEDPDTFVQKKGKEVFLAEVAGAMTVPDFLFKGLGERADMSRIGWQLRLAELAQPYLSKVPAGLLRETMTDRLVLSRPLYDKLAAKTEPRRIAAMHVGPQRPAPIMRLAIALLVQNPQLARQVTDVSAYQGLELAGADLFRALLGALAEARDLNTAAVVEHFRGTEYEQSVAKIATWTHSALVQDIEAEFRGVLEQLRRTALKEKIEALLQKEKVSGLTAVEKRELADLTRPPVAAAPAHPSETR